MNEPLDNVLNLRISKNDHEAASQHAYNIGMTLSQYVRFLIRQDLKK